jgi:hypothetical protein
MTSLEGWLHTLVGFSSLPLWPGEITPRLGWLVMPVQVLVGLSSAPYVGTVIHRGRSMAVGTSDVFDADGKKVAVATGSSVILPGRPATVTTLS